MKILLFCVAVAFAGSARFVVVADDVVSSRIPQTLEKVDLQVSGRVSGLPIHRSGSLRFDFRVDEVSIDAANPIVGKLIRLKIYDDLLDIQNGEQWTLMVRLKRPRGYSNPGSVFDYERYLFAHRLAATGYVRKNAANVRHPKIDSSLAVTIDQFREQWSDFVGHTLASVSPQSIGIVAALTVGIRSALTDHQWELLRRTGTSHLMAISGLHVGLVAATVAWLISFVWRMSPASAGLYPSQLSGLPVAAIAAVGYAAIAGFTVPTQRAMAMVCLAILLLWSRRRSEVSTVLLWVAAAVVMTNPMVILMNGFWLSFGAVTVLVVSASRYRRMTTRDESERKIRSVILAWWRTQRDLFLLLAPLLLFLFAKLSLISPVANLFAIPLVGFVVVPVSLLALLCWSVDMDSSAAILLHAASVVVDAVLQILHWMSALPMAYWSGPLISLPELIGMYCGLALFILRRWIPCGWIGLVLIASVFVPQISTLKTGEFRYTMLDIGHGLASTIETKTRLLVYDTGPRFPGGYDAGASVVVPFLRDLNRTPDLLIVSHGDNDHIGGSGAVVNDTKVSRILTSVPERFENAEQCSQGQRWEWDDVRFEVVWPSANALFAGNDGSCVLKVTGSGGSALLTGDIEKPAERQLVANSRNLLDADILQVPHQGSRTSSTDPFLDAVSPKLAIVSTAHLNRYNHPHSDVLQRYRNRNIGFFNTSSSGAIQLNVTSDGIFINEWRRSNPKLWHDAADPQ